MAVAQRRGVRAFLRQVADELPAHLPPALRTYESFQWGRMYKVWFREPRIHFEVQFLSRRELQIGLHLESDAATVSPKPESAPACAYPPGCSTFGRISMTPVARPGSASTIRTPSEPGKVSLKSRS